MERKAIWFLVFSFILSALAMTGQYISWEIENLRVEAIARAIEYDALEQEYKQAISNDGYVVPEIEYLVFPFFEDSAIYITSQFHLRANPFEDNVGPSLPEEKIHRGIDIKSFKQNLIRATVHGQVVAHWPTPNGYWRGDGPHGGRIIIMDANGIFHSFSHLSDTFVSTLEGKNIVEAGQPIGRMGNTGLTTGSHLHYEIYSSPHPEGLVVEGETTWYDPIYYFDIRVDDYGRVMFPEEEEDILIINSETNS